MESLPNPFILPNRYFQCLLRGPALRTLARISLVMATQASLDKAESEVFTVDGGDRHRYDKTKTIVLKRYVNSFSRTHAKSNCALTSHRPSVANGGLAFNEHGVCVFECLVEGSGGGPYEIQAQDKEGNLYSSSLFVVCSEALEVATTPAEWEEQLEQAPEEFPKSWLKDKGAKTKTINFKVFLTGPPRRLPLKARLVYSDGTMVPSQAILNVTNDHSLELSEKQRQCEIKFRINEVSKNHQSKAFVVVVEPTSTSEEWIAPAASYPVVIKSKVNHRTSSQTTVTNAVSTLGGSNPNKRGRKASTEPGTFLPQSPRLPAAAALDSFPTVPGDISSRLASNSRERDEVEKLLQDQQEKMIKLQAKMGDTMRRLFELGKQRKEIETDFGSFMTSSPQYSATAERLLGSGQSLAHAIAAPPPVALTNSIAQVLPENIWPASVSFTMDDFGKPSALFRLGSGDLMGWGQSQAHNPSLSKMLSDGSGNGEVSTTSTHNSEEDEEDGDEDDEEEDEDASGMVDYEYMGQGFVDIPGWNKQGILAFNSQVKLVGYFEWSTTQLGNSIPPWYQCLATRMGSKSCYR
ncbi:hypothetical protein BASA81_000491 [Batrachochytrium salamandrivorans]|nr:hypothetical protein BASA81_000491 [Batrachochytrium salamandrivorans]